MEANENVDSKDQLDSSQALLDSLNSMAGQDKKDIGQEMRENHQVKILVEEANLSLGGSNIKNESISFGPSNMVDNSQERETRQRQELSSRIQELEKGMGGNSQESGVNELSSEGKEMLQNYAEAMGAEKVSPELEANFKETIAALDSSNPIEKAKAEATMNVLSSMIKSKQVEGETRQRQELSSRIQEVVTGMGGNGQGTESLTEEGKELVVAVEAVQQAIADNNMESLTEEGKELAVVVEAVQQAITDNNMESLTEEGKALAAVMNTISNSNMEDRTTPEDLSKGNNETTDKSKGTGENIVEEREGKVAKAIARIIEAKAGIYPINSPEGKQIKTSVTELLNNSSLGVLKPLNSYNKITVVDTPTGSECSLSSLDGKNVKVMFNKADSTYKLTQNGRLIGSGRS